MTQMESQVFDPNHNAFICRTTTGRYDYMLYERMDLHNSLDFVDFLHEKKAISDNEKNRLVSMLKSEDPADHLIAQEIIKQVKWQ